MRRRKLPYLWALLLALPLVALCFLLQSIPTEVQEASRPYVPEKWDLYGPNGMRDTPGLSEKKLMETEKVVAYADRVFQLNTVLPRQSGYALEVAQAVKAYCPELAHFYLLPIPGRGVLEPDYPAQREQYDTLVQELTARGDVIEVLPQLLENGDRNLFYRTENGWNMEGAFYGYQAVLDTLGMEPDNLMSFRTYLFGTFRGSVVNAQRAAGKSKTLVEALGNIPSDPYYIYINGRNPNREKVTSRAADGSLETVARRTIRMNSLGPGGIVAEDTYLHSLVNGRGTGGVVLVTDSVGKLLAPYLSEIYQWVYVVNVEKDRAFRQDLPGILEEIGADTVIYAASETRMGNRSYMRALNPFIRGEE